MLQRVQSLYFLGIIIAYILLFFLPIASVTDQIVFYMYGVKLLIHIQNFQAPSTALLIANSSLIIILTATITFLYTNRPLQMKLSRSGLLLNLVMLMLLFFHTDEIATNLKLTISYGYALSLPIVSIIFYLLAIQAIKHDEEKVKSADRLR